MQTIVPALIDYVSETRRLDSQLSSTKNAFDDATAIEGGGDFLSANGWKRKRDRTIVVHGLDSRA